MQPVASGPEPLGWMATPVKLTVGPVRAACAAAAGTSAARAAAAAKAALIMRDMGFPLSPPGLVAGMRRW
jgi:hypothetical protein